MIGYKCAILNLTWPRQLNPIDIGDQLLHIFIHILYFVYRGGLQRLALLMWRIPSECWRTLISAIFKTSLDGLGTMGTRRRLLVLRGPAINLIYLSMAVLPIENTFIIIVQILRCLEYLLRIES